MDQKIHHINTDAPQCKPDKIICQHTSTVTVIWYATSVFSVHTSQNTDNQCLETEYLHAVSSSTSFISGVWGLIGDKLNDSLHI